MVVLGAQAGTLVRRSVPDIDVTVEDRQRGVDSSAEQRVVPHELEVAAPVANTLAGYRTRQGGFGCAGTPAARTTSSGDSAGSRGRCRACTAWSPRTATASA